MAQIQKGTTYSTGDQVTATNLNALADAAILLPGAITDQTAKTVPLAADTVLIHSAADTALRKSTLTQLFSNATGIPLTTGVTGILPAANGGTGVNNGANTITIAGNVTHAGAFTQTFTATANTSLTLPVTGTLATLAGSEALSNKTITASPISGSTGAFTTLSASGVTTIGNGSSQNSVFDLIVGSADATTGDNSGVVVVNNATGKGWIGFNNANNASIPGQVTYDHSTNTLALVANGVATANVTSTGLAVTGAIGARSGGQLQLWDSANTDYAYINNTGSSSATQSISYYSSGSGSVAHQFKTYSGAVINALAITPAGNVGIGTASPGEKLTVYSATDTYATVRSASHVLAFNAGTGFIGSAATSIYNTSAIPMIFGTNNAERVRIDSSGNLLVGTTTASASPATGVQLCNTSGTLGGVFIGHDTGTANGNYYATFAYASGIIGSITQSTTSAVLYNTTSDYRRKSNVKDLTGSGAFIDALKPRTFDWDTGDKGVGFIAHEFAEVSPSSVSGEKDAVDADGKPVYQAMQASSAEVIANLVAELQSVRQRLAALETK
jgi:hypothetical protein